MAPCFIHFTFMQIIFLIYVLATFTNAASLVSHDQECLALFNLKQSTLLKDYASSDGFQKFKSWKRITTNTSDNGTDCCMWDAVGCNTKGQVIQLDLSNSFVHGPINSKSNIFKLLYLQSLNLSMNDFAESQIPSRISSLKQLRILDLSNSNFSGQVPIEISHLLQLSSIDLSLNPLKLQFPSLGSLLQNFTKLEVLNLSGVDIDSFVPKSFGNFSSLMSISLEDCNLQDEFPSAVFHLPKLKFLNMRNNPDLIGSLPEFQNNTLLEQLNLRSTGFGGIIPESISKLNHLTYLSLDECYFSGHVPRSLSNMTQLTHLGLGLNKLTGLLPSLESLSKLIVLQLSENLFDTGSMNNWIGTLTNLERLYLNILNIQYEILPSLANLTKLTYVTMTENFIFGHIPSSFMNLTQLTYIDFRANQLQGPISSLFSNFINLAYLNLGSNNFTGTVHQDTLFRLKKLTALDLDDNKITFVTTNNYTSETLPQFTYLGLSYCNLTEFPSFLRFQTSMGGLFLQGNNIKGLVPEWIWNNSQETMQLFDISSNYITGFHHRPRILPWASLGVLMLNSNQLLGPLPIPPLTTVYYDSSNNNLTGEIPSSICEAKSLQLLDLSSNNLTGTLPSCLSSLSNSLSVLNLKQNNFHGPMMNTFTHGSLLQRIDLSENQFTGQLSKSLANCTNLEVLSLGDNSFSDVFPFWLGTLSKLEVLILSSNKFYGAIHGPNSVKSQFSKMRIIDLSNNGFSGQVPEIYFQSWNAMKSVYVGKSIGTNLGLDFQGFTGSYEYSMTLTNKGVKTEYEKILKIFTAIDLSRNNFEGQIPQSLTDLQGLQSLNLSNNHLTGHVLPSLGNLKNLESLDLSQNKLTGKIPLELLQLGFLSILNVSFNGLDGPIPQGKQFSTFENTSYMGNHGLCGEPLSMDCGNPKPNTLPPSKNESVSLLPSDRVDWIVIFSGVASGLVIGIVFGKSRHERYVDWFVDLFGLREDKWIRPLRNQRRN